MIFRKFGILLKENSAITNFLTKYLTLPRNVYVIMYTHGFKVFLQCKIHYVSYTLTMTHRHNTLNIWDSKHSDFMMKFEHVKQRIAKETVR